MRTYEEMFIVKPDASEEEVDQLIEQAGQTITSGGGTLDKIDRWGVRRLAYRVEKWNEGYYVVLQFSSNPEAVKEVERRFRVTDSVMKFLTVRTDERLKKIEKRRKQREKRAKRKPAPMSASSAPGAPSGAPGRPAAPEAPTPAAPTPAAPAPAAPAPAAPVAAEPPAEAGKE
jgi:small subunit ribosomal protein S6